MTPAKLTLRLTALLAAAAAPASAHHNSNALFDLESEVTLNGIVTEYEWANPHVYIFIDVADSTGSTVNWEVEAGPVALMRRLGWSPDSLTAGDSIRLVGNPSRRSDRNGAYLVSAARADEALPTTRGDAYDPLLEGNAKATGQADGLAGVWATVLDIEAIGPFEDDAALPLTPAGVAAQEAFDETTMHPGIDCRPFTPPISMLTPDIKSIEVEDGLVRIRGEFDNTERLVDLDGSHRTAGPSRIHGRSVGRFEDGVLIIETTDFPPHRSGISMGVPSGPRKRMVERLQPSADGQSLRYSFEIDDPDYLTEPVTGSLRWVFRPDLSFEGLPCDLSNARRFVDD